jgi:hypothetical protein
MIGEGGEDFLEWWDPLTSGMRDIQGREGREWEEKEGKRGGGRNENEYEGFSRREERKMYVLLE